MALADSQPISPSTFPVWAGSAGRLRFLLGYAVMAPSRHNAQPWIFEIEGDEARLYGDRRRELPACDPHGRALVMGCGAALLNLRVAAGHFGYATSTEVVARPRDDLLARLRLEERHRPPPEDEPLFAAIPRRRTNRLPLDGREPPPGLVAALCHEAGLEGAELRAVEEFERRAVAELVAEGDLVQWRDPRFRAELADWIRTNASHRPDGMPGYSLGMSDAASWVQPLLRRFTDPGPAEAERDRRRALASRALLVLCTRGDAPADWLAAGQALERVLLRATAAGLHASYLCSAVDVPELRARLRQVLGECAHPQVLFRLGYGLPVRTVPRRPVAAVLRSLATPSAPPRPLATRQ